MLFSLQRALFHIRNRRCAGCKLVEFRQNHNLMRYYAILIILLCMIIQCVFSIRDKTATYDEPCHLSAGYSYLTTSDFKMNFEHPPLTKMIAALPLLFFKLKHPAQIGSWQGTDSFAFGREFLYHSGQDADKIIFWGRLPMILLSAMLGLLVFVWAEEIFGLMAGLFALFLYSFNPDILAYSRLITPDIGLCLFMTLALYCLWKYLRKPTVPKLVITAISLGFAFLTKFHAFILIPAFVILIYLYSPKRRFFNALILSLLIFSVSAFTVWSVYGFTRGKVLKGKNTHDTLSRMLKDSPSPVQNLVYRLGSVTLPAPSYAEGIGWAFYINSIERRQSFLWGRRFSGGARLWLGFLFVFLIKTPVPFLIFILLALVISARKKSIFSYDSVFLLLLPVSFFAFTSLTVSSLRLRYVLFIYPFFCIFVSQIVKSGISCLPGVEIGCARRKDVSRRHALRAVFLGMCFWYLAGAVRAYPHYLAYFNEFAGGPRSGYKYLVDYNLDAGQDLLLLKRYMDANKIKEVKLAYFGMADPGYYGIGYQALEPFMIVSGWVVVSATYLQGLHTPEGGYRWLKEYKPVKKLGHTIFVYHI